MPKPALAPDDEVQLQIRMTRALRDRLKLRAVKESRDMSTMARLLIVDGLKRTPAAAAAADLARKVWAKREARP